MKTVAEIVSLANRSHREGRLSEARSFSEQALVREPSSFPATLLLGVIAFKQHRLEESVEILERASGLDSSSFQAAFWLSLACRALQRSQEALAASLRATELDARQGSALNQLGLCYLDIGNWEAAEGAFRQAVALEPGNSTVHENLGRVLHKQHRRHEARAAYEQAINLDSSKEKVILRLGNTLVSDLDYSSGLYFGSRLVKENPASVAGNLLIAKALIGLGKAEEAVEYGERALSLESKSPEANSVFASVLDALGKTVQARRHYERSIELNPIQGFPYYALVRGVKVRDRSIVDRIEQVLGDPRTLADHRIYLRYALGKVYEDLGLFEESMRAYDEANLLAGRGVQPEGVLLQNADRAKNTISRFTKTFLGALPEIGSASELPLFVVGMMRSGTTLVEQVLSSHPGVGSAGELPFWSRHEEDGFEALPQLATEYLGLLADSSAGGNRVVDKMPDNYRRLGLIHLAFPRAKIVHVRRHPLDTCLSLWSTPRACPPDWGNRKASIVAEYELYLRFMDHWRQALPADTLLEIRYEDLVSEPEPTIRGLLAFAGLEWDARCLRPEENLRAVNTPSVVQVRKEIHSNSVERWRRFEPWLEFRRLCAADGGNPC